MKEKAIIEEEKIKVAKLAEIEKEKMKEEIQMMLDEERVKAKEEKEALRAQMMSQASESEEQRVKASLEMERILDDLRIQVTQLHFERNMASVCDFPSTFLRHVEDVSSSEVRVVYSSTPHRGISNSPKWRSNNDVSRIRCDIESSSVAGDWTNRISLESSPGVSEMEDTEPLTPLYSHTLLEFSPRNQLIGDNSRNQSPGSRSITGASNNFSDLDTNGDRCSYER